MSTSAEEETTDFEALTLKKKKKKWSNGFDIIYENIAKRVARLPSLLIFMT